VGAAHPAGRGSLTPASPFLTAEWRDVVLLNFEVAPARLAPFVPTGTRLDLHEGRALVSLVAFRFVDTRLLGLPIPLHRRFPELNLRFYVRRDLAAGRSLGGVVFLSELVPRFAVAAVARLAYNEPYRTVPMRHSADGRDTEAPGLAMRLRYGWRLDGRWHTLEVSTRGVAKVPDAGTEAHFVSSHDWGYTRQRDGSTVEYEVSRPAWRVCPATCERFEPDPLALALVPELSGRPASAYVSDGSAVAVSRPHRLARE
jgi:uncharacterized protein YqjF (DUF2071 family)